MTYIPLLLCVYSRMRRSFERRALAALFFLVSRSALAYTDSLSRLGPTVSAPPLLASLRPPWITGSQVAAGPFIDPVSAAPIQHATDAAITPPLLGALRPEASRRVSTPAVPPEMSSPVEIEFIESVDRYSPTDCAREQRSEPICDAAIQHLLLGSSSVIPNNFLLHAPPHNLSPLSEVRSLADKGCFYTDNDGIFLLVRKLTPPAPVCPDRPGGRGPPLTRRTCVNIPPGAHAPVDYATVP